MKILVTGGTGVVGAAVIPELLRAGHTVRVLSRHAADDTRRFPAGVEPFPANIDQPLELVDAPAGCEVVLHIAGIVEEEPPGITFQRINVDGTRHLLDAAARTGNPRFIFLSSLGADTGQSEYQRSKRDAEAPVRGYSGPWLILRAAAVYGPGDETISMLLKMVRSLPAVPMIDQGDQPFQPLWYRDLGRAMARAVEDSSIAGETLELAGDETTTTDDVLSRLEQITGRSPARLGVPAWLTEIGAQAAEAFGGLGRRLLERARLPMPINSAKLTMLVEGNVIQNPAGNALQNRLGVEPTSLQDGLAALADMLPEQIPGEGVGAIEWTRYFADIQGTTLAPEELLDRVCERITDVMPLEFAAEPDVPERAHEGATLTAAIPGRGHIQVRVEERNPTSVTFITLEGHPLAGVLRFETTQIDDEVRFSIHITAQPANVLDWIAMRTIGGAMQTANWRAVVRRVVDLSGGVAPKGVQRDSGRFDGRETQDLEAWAQRIVQRHHRLETETEIAYPRRSDRRHA